MNRTIETILKNRNDFSPFLIHLTRASTPSRALKNLRNILDSELIKARNLHGLFKYDRFFGEIPSREKAKILKAVCFTETPPLEIPTIIGEIDFRSDRLDPFGLMFSKKYLMQKGVNPVFYSNSFKKKSIVNSLVKVLEEYVQNDLKKFMKLGPFLSLVESFGPGVLNKGKKVDFHWEREWRISGNFGFKISNVLLGLCPSKFIGKMERDYRPLEFIDPLAHPSHWGEKLIKAHKKAWRQYFR